MKQNSIEIKLLYQITNLEKAIDKLDNQLRCLSHDLSYRSINRLTYDARKHQLEFAKQNILNTIYFLQHFNNIAKGIDMNGFITT